MAVVELSKKLENFKSTYNNFNTAKTKKGDVVIELQKVTSGLENILDDLTTAGNDSTILEIKNSVTLSKDGINRINESLDETFSKLEADCNEVITLIDDINKKIETAKDKSNEISRIVINDTMTNEEKSSVESKKENLEKEIDRLNEEIEFKNNEGEKKLDAIQEAMSSISFGVIGNMIKGGSLGVKKGYECGYTIKDYVSASTPGETDDAVAATDEVPDKDEKETTTLGGKISERFEQDWTDFLSDVNNRWANVNGFVSGVGGVIGTVYEGLDFLAEGAIDVATGALDTINSVTNWFFDGFNPRSGTTDEFWQNFGNDYAENWKTFGEYDSWWKYIANPVVGIARTVVDLGQTVQNAATTAVDWTLDNAVGSVLDFIGDAWGWVNGLLW